MVLWSSIRKFIKWNWLRNESERLSNVINKFEVQGISVLVSIASGTQYVKALSIHSILLPSEFEKFMWIVLEEEQACTR